DRDDQNGQEEQHRRDERPARKGGRPGHLTLTHVLHTVLVDGGGEVGGASPRSLNHAAMTLPPQGPLRYANVAKSLLRALHGQPPWAGRSGAGPFVARASRRSASVRRYGSAAAGVQRDPHGDGKNRGASPRAAATRRPGPRGRTGGARSASGRPLSR